jgi:hypothetical protein
MDANILQVEIDDDMRQRFGLTHDGENLVDNVFASSPNSSRLLPERRPLTARVTSAYARLRRDSGGQPPRANERSW